MTLENQVCSLELSKRLRELRVKQESYAYWCGYVPENIIAQDDAMKVVDVTDYGEYEWLLSIAQRNEHPGLKARYAAFTVAELGEMLPRYLIRNGFSFGTDDTEAAARAKMLIYLIENKLITL